MLPKSEQRSGSIEAPEQTNYDCSSNETRNLLYFTLPSSEILCKKEGTPKSIFDNFSKKIFFGRKHLTKPKAKMRTENKTRSRNQESRTGNLKGRIVFKYLQALTILKFCFVKLE